MKYCYSQIRDGVGARLGSGNYATVYDLPDHALSDAQFPLVFKRYRETTLPVSATSLDLIAQVRDALPNGQRRTLDSFTTWPVRVVTSPRAPAQSVGILMRRLPDPCFFDYRTIRGGVVPKPRELQFASQDDDFVRSVGLRALTTDERLEIVRSLARALASLHKLNVVYGDLSGSNIIYTDANSVVLVDCDSALLEGNVSAFKRQPHTNGFEPPEAGEALKRLKRAKSSSAPHHQQSVLASQWARQTKATDVYKFSLIIVRLLDYGANKGFQADPTLAMTKLPAGTRDLLKSSLAASPSSRPTMADWYSELFPERGGNRPGPQRDGLMPGWKKRPDGSWHRA